MKKFNFVILPGWGGNQETWDDFVKTIKNDYDKIKVIDLPCFGDQPCPPTVWGVEEYTDFVKQQIDKLNFENVVLLGHSFGGQVAANFAYKNPEKINRLILSGAAIFRPSFPIKRLTYGAIAKFGKILFKFPFVEKGSLFAKKLLYRTIGSKDYEETSGIKREIFKKIIRQDLRKILPKIKVKTLILWGEKDQYVPVKFGKKIFKLIPNSQLQILDGAGHGLHIKNKQEMNVIIKNFLSHD